MHRRRDFLAGVAGLSIALAIGVRPVRASAAAMAMITENELIAKIDPTIWVSLEKGDFPNPQGGIDLNRKRYYQVGFQSQTFGLFAFALLHKSTHFLDGACLVAEYAFQHQHADGSFDYSEPDGSAFNPGSGASSLTGFFADLGHSLLLLKRDDWYSHSDECAPYRKRMAALTPKILTSLDWLLGYRAVLAQDRAASNRTLTHGQAYYYVGKALGRGDATAAGKEIISQDLDTVSGGVFPEARGFDSSYQAFNVLECQWIALNSDSDFRDRVWNAAVAGMARERRSVTSTGEVLTAGNTRISATGEVLYGHRKSVNSKQILLAFAYYGILAGDDSATQDAARIQQFYGLPTK